MSPHNNFSMVQQAQSDWIDKRRSRADEDVQKVGTDLMSIPNIIAADFVSKEEGYEEQLKEFGVEKDLFDDVIENPLPHSYRISVSNLEEFSITLQQIQAVENVESVRESQELVNQISVIQKILEADSFPR